MSDQAQLPCHPFNSSTHNSQPDSHCERRSHASAAIDTLVLPVYSSDLVYH